MQSAQPYNIVEFPFDVNSSILKEIQEEELKLRNNQKEKIFIEATLKYLKSRLAIPWQKAIDYCLRTGTGKVILKTPLEVSNCIAFNFGFEASREMKNNVSTTISEMFNQKELGRIYLNGKNRYGAKEYFDQDKEGFLTILKDEYKKELNT